MVGLLLNEYFSIHRNCTVGLECFLDFFMEQFVRRGNSLVSAACNEMESDAFRKSKSVCLEKLLLRQEELGDGLIRWVALPITDAAEE